MLQATSIVNVDISDTIIAIHEKRQLQISILVWCLETARTFKSRRGVMQSIRSWIKESVGDAVLTFQFFLF